MLEDVEFHVFLPLALCWSGLLWATVNDNWDSPRNASNGRAGPDCFDGPFWASRHFGPAADSQFRGQTAVDRAKPLAAILALRRIFAKLPGVGTLNESPRSKVCLGYGRAAGFAKGPNEKRPGARTTPGRIEMKPKIHAFIAAGGLLIPLSVADPVFAQKQGGILKMYSPDSPPAFRCFAGSA